MKERSDSELWAATQAGDSLSFGELYERHANAIYNYLFRRLGDWGEAEDLTAVVFLEAFRRRREVTVDDGKVLAWLYGVATNVVRNRRRALWRHRRALFELPTGASTPDVAADTVARIGAQERMRAIRDRVKSLPRAQQDVLALCLWSELSCEEAAIALGVPSGTIRSRLARARKALGEQNSREGHKQDARYREEMT